MAATLSGFDEPATTVAPASANASAMARPMPVVPPLTKQTLPEMSSSGCVMSSHLDRLERIRVERDPRLARDLGQRVDLGAREEQPPRFVAPPREVGLGLTGQDAPLVPLAEDIGEDRTHVFDLAPALGEGPAVERVGADALEEKARRTLLVRVARVPPAAQGRQRSAGQRRV